MHSLSLNFENFLKALKQIILTNYNLRVFENDPNFIDTAWKIYQDKAEEMIKDQTDFSSLKATLTYYMKLYNSERKGEYRYADFVKSVVECTNGKSEILVFRNN